MLETSADLELHFLGDLRVVHQGRPQTLPPSKKTRALLAYLALQKRAFRREHLCELLWEIPDDPRGSLRWSLSKIRALVDSDHCRRIEADRNQVRFADRNTDIDVLALYRIADGDLDRVSTENLREAADRFSGNFLEGLELTNFYAFYAWCVAEREKVTQARARVLSTLVNRVAQDPHQALPYARALVLNSPYEEYARATLIRLLVSAGRPDEAEQQYLLGKRILEEVGDHPTQRLYEAWRGKPGMGRQASDRHGNPGVGIRASQPVLSGREVEVGQLTETLTAVCHRGKAEFVLVTGAAGIGKTRLLDEFANQARSAGSAVLSAGGRESSILRPFGLWIDALKSLNETGNELLSNAGKQRGHLLNALSETIARLTARQPVVLLFDDVQWCDDSSAAAMAFLAQSNREQPMLCILSAREAEVDENRQVQQLLRTLRHDQLLHELPLGPLDKKEVEAIILQQAPGVNATELGLACGGNPLLAIELARAVAQGNDPHSLDHVIKDRLSRLDPEAADVLRWAALLSRGFEVDSLAEITGLNKDSIGDVLVAAEQQALIVRETYGYRISHDLVAASIYNQISPARRRVMHRKVAEWLEKNTALDLNFAADLAHHATLSGDSLLAARALVSAGRLSLRFFANRDARSLAEKGLLLAEKLQDADRICLTLEYHDILLSAAPVTDWQGAARQYSMLAEQALDHGAIHHARLGYYMASYLRWSHGHWHGAREESLQAERITRGGTPEEHIVGMAEAAKCLAMLEQDLPRAETLLMEAQSLADRTGTLEHAIAAARGILHYHANRFAEAEEDLQQARTQAKARGERIEEFLANEYLAMTAFERGQFDQAFRYSNELVSLGERLREGSEAPFACAFHALCRYAITDDDSGLDPALDQLRAADAKHRLAYILTRAAVMDNTRGRHGTALARASEALECALVLDRATEILLARLALAEAHRQLANIEARQQQIDEIHRLSDRPVAIWARERALAYLHPPNP